jgi:hypothetical protein
MEDSEQKKEALGDIKNYGLTLKELDFGLSKDSAKGAKKGGMYGAGAGVVLLGGASIRRGLKRRKSKKNLEQRLSIFLGLLAGGIGLSLTFSNFSGVVTGNVIRNANYSSSGIIGIILLIAGCIGTYFYFKE